VSPGDDDPPAGKDRRRRGNLPRLSLLSAGIAKTSLAEAHVRALHGGTGQTRRSHSRGRKDISSVCSVSFRQACVIRFPGLFRHLSVAKRMVERRAIVEPVGPASLERRPSLCRLGRVVEGWAVPRGRGEARGSWRSPGGGDPGFGQRIGRGWGVAWECRRRDARAPRKRECSVGRPRPRQ